MKTLARLSNSSYSFDTVDDSVVVTRFSTKFDGYIFMDQGTFCLVLEQEELFVRFLCADGFFWTHQNSIQYID